MAPEEIYFIRLRSSTSRRPDPRTLLEQLSLLPSQLGGALREAFTDPLLFARDLSRGVELAVNNVRGTGGTLDAFVDDSWVGRVSFTHDRRGNVWLHSLFVRKLFRRRGIATALVVSAIEHLRAAPVESRSYLRVFRPVHPASAKLVELIGDGGCLDLADSKTVSRALEVLLGHLDDRFSP